MQYLFFCKKKWNTHKIWHSKSDYDKDNKHTICWWNVLWQSFNASGMFLIVNSLRLRVNRHPFAEYILKCIFLNENEWILPWISLKFVPKVRFNNIPELVQIMAWRRPGDKPLSETMMVSLVMHICVTRPQWVNSLRQIGAYMRQQLHYHCFR